MTAPSAKLRRLVYTRDGACLSCGSTYAPSYQHRAAVGAGGSGKKAPALTPSDGIWLCLFCNQAAETSAGQSRALSLGFKIRRNRGGFPADRIPVYDRNDRFWYLLNLDGSRTAIISTLAQELLLAAGNIDDQVSYGAPQ